ENTNDISLVTFLTCNGVKFIFPGDLEGEGWGGMLSQPGFADELNDVNIFVASHHGRRNGYRADVMRLAAPNVVVMSDSPINYATQETVNLYGSHCSGIEFNGEPRRVLTTRNDGSLTWRL
ncbi:MAG TPA: hypothetical protein VLA52_06945, partial [Thermohalobaculum sp.]|nr:hypothetical protein [Thermohalobaculum sp.]